jgi:hypothetical protein
VKLFRGGIAAGGTGLDRFVYPYDRTLALYYYFIFLLISLRFLSSFDQFYRDFAHLFIVNAIHSVGMTIGLLCFRFKICDNAFEREKNFQPI